MRCDALAQICDRSTELSLQRNLAAVHCGETPSSINRGWGRSTAGPSHYWKSPVGNKKTTVTVPIPISAWGSALDRKGRGKAFKITKAGGGTAPNATDAMTLDQIERWISDHIKPK